VWSIAFVFNRRSTCHSPGSVSSRFRSILIAWHIDRDHELLQRDACSPQISHADVTSKHPSRCRGYPEIERTMPGFSFPTAYDPQMHREEVLTLSRTISQQNATHKVNGNSAKPSLAPSPTMTSPSVRDTPSSPQRRHYVFADPVAFRWVKARRFPATSAD
jgi:hypothetical protein